MLLSGRDCGPPQWGVFLSQDQEGMARRELGKVRPGRPHRPLLLPPLPSSCPNPTPLTDCDPALARLPGTGPAPPCPAFMAKWGRLTQVKAWKQECVMPLWGNPHLGSVQEAWWAEPGGTAQHLPWPGPHCSWCLDHHVDRVLCKRKHCIFSTY